MEALKPMYEMVHSQECYKKFTEKKDQSLIEINDLMKKKSSPLPPMTIDKLKSYYPNIDFMDITLITHNDPCKLGTLIEWSKYRPNKCLYIRPDPLHHWYIIKKFMTYNQNWIFYKGREQCFHDDATKHSLKYMFENIIAECSVCYDSLTPRTSRGSDAGKPIEGVKFTCGQCGNCMCGNCLMKSLCRNYKKCPCCNYEGYDPLTDEEDDLIVGQAVVCGLLWDSK
jgi:hypothetical protein